MVLNGYNYKESWVPKNWCFWTVVLERTLESPLDSKETQPVHPKGNQSWIFIGRTDAEAETPIYFGHLMQRADSLERLKAGEGAIEDEMVRWHQQLNGHEFGWAPGVGEAWCAAVHGVTKSQTRLNWTESQMVLNDYNKIKSWFYSK